MEIRHYSEDLRSSTFAKRSIPSNEIAVALACNTSGASWIHTSHLVLVLSTVYVRICEKGPYCILKCATSKKRISVTLCKHVCMQTCVYRRRVATLKQWHGSEVLVRTSPARSQYQAEFKNGTTMKACITGSWNRERFWLLVWDGNVTLWKSPNFIENVRYGLFS